MSDFYARLRASARRYPVIAFDVFDTLIYRDAAQPDDVFFLMEETGRAAPGFGERRIRAESDARKAAPGREITLEEIYRRLPGDQPAAELAAELAWAVPNGAMLDFYRWCREQGKSVYVISDMYLPQSQIFAMLKKCGYDQFHQIFVSSEWQVQKRSGKLFACFLQQTGLRRQDVLFVGNDRRADQIGAALAGIRCALLPPRRRLPYTELPQGTKQSGQAYAAVQNRTGMARSRAEALGMELLGPLAVGFCHWLHRQKKPGETLYFLARDMELVCSVYRYLYPQEQAVYLRVSRRSLCAAALLSGDEMLLLALLPRQPLSAAQLADYCGLAPDEFDKTAKINLRNNPDAALQAVLRQLMETGRQDRKTCRQAALTMRYLNEQGLMQRPALLVDIGSGGTTQYVLQKLGAKNLRGAYLACDERLLERFPPDETVVYLFEGEPASLWYWCGQPILELFLSEPCGTVSGYRELDGTVQPLIAAVNRVPDELKELRRGAWSYAVTAGEIECPSEQVIAPFLKMIRCPLIQDVCLLGDLCVEDGDYYPLAPAGPGKLRAARWKTGYLKRLVKLPLPYDKLYEWIKKWE